MERFENIIKIEEIRRLIDDNQYIKAAKILDTMDISKIKALTDLSILADVLIQNERYEEAMEILLKMYNKSKTRRVLYQLVDVSIRMEDVESASKYLDMYIKVAPSDPQRFIFRYCIDKLNQEPYEILIDSLEQLKEHEYIEVWAYELAKVYHKAGMIDKCVRECSDIILWFGEGIFVEKAKLLKAFYAGEIKESQIINAKDRKEFLHRLSLEKTKDYSEMREEINRYLSNEELKGDKPSSEEDLDKESSYINKDNYPIIENEAFNDQELDKEVEDKEQDEYINNESLKEATENFNEDYEKDNKDYTTEGYIKEIEEAASTNETLEKRYELNEASSQESTLLDSDAWEDDAELEEISQESESYDLYGYLENVGFYAKEEFGAFFLVKGIKEQIQIALENILSDRLNMNHLVIAGEPRSGKTTLAKKICKAMYALNWIKSSKIAKISGEKLNRLNLVQQREKLYNSTLIIENVSRMDENGCNMLAYFLDEMKDTIFVILEDELEKIQKFFLNNLTLYNFFKNKVVIPSFTGEDLKGFAIELIEKNNYQFLENVKEEFFQKIELILINRENAFEKVMSLTKSTIKNADNRYKENLSEINNENLDNRQLYIEKEDIKED